MNNSIYLNLSENSVLFNTNLTTIFTSFTTQLPPSSQSPTQVPVPKWYESGRVQIPLYSIIFLLAVIGNSLVILTLVQNKRMRTITNVFLLNLAISDLLLGVLCMPFTLVGTLLRNFIFGEVMCKLLPYLQASSVSVSSWTLVAISVERYYAICHPLRSRRWQTLNHSYKLIFVIWISSLICMIPIAALSQLKPTNKGHHKCREDWPSIDYERAFTLFLDIILLILPLLFLSVTYSLIVITLWKGFQNEQPQINSKQQTNKNTSTNSEQQSNGLRRSNVEKNLHNKKRIIQMLFVVILEFFICWTPLYVINTIALFNPRAIYIGLGYTAISFFQLLAYSSSCCNPITYCFMNCGFRKSFLNLFGCMKKVKKRRQNQMVTTPDRDRFVNTTMGVGAGITSEIDSTAVVKWTHHTQNQSNLIVGQTSSHNTSNR
ncbi:cholecystokinin receptor-like [Chrysoperla carnea]|uniref:cholecystokinin receptor-like n=1 Tax=Chrysoperla carnea TaxID=189513 RepID=UPI001D087309|nr:cholecystokinin receptor-like [Chrysoperla carnea]